MNKVELSDGRRLEYFTVGPEDGLPLVLHHPMPALPHPFGLLARSAARRGFRLIAPTRPGYGASTPSPGRTVGDSAADVAALLDTLGVERFVAVGIAGGGPHALACAAWMPGRCSAVATIAGLAPYAVTEPEWFDSLYGASLAEFEAALEGAAPLSRLIEACAVQLARTRPTDLKMDYFSRLADVDREALHGELAEHLAASVRAATRLGVAGWRDDDLAYVSDWGFEPSALGVPVAVWHGELDLLVSIRHARWLSAAIPGADPHYLAGDGHLSILRRFGAVIDHLAATVNGGPTAGAVATGHDRPSADPSSDGPYRPPNREI